MVTFRLRSIFTVFTLLLIGCAYNHEVVPRDRNLLCNRSLQINGLTEYFCGSIHNNLVSPITSSPDDSLKIIRDQNFPFTLRASEHFQAFSISFRAEKKDSLTYENELEFFNNLNQLMRPDSKHLLNISVNGGFSIELWDKDGTYYSTEFGPQSEEGMILIREITSHLFGPITGQIISYMTLTFTSTHPIILWNSSRTKSFSVDIFSNDMDVSFY